MRHDDWRRGGDAGEAYLASWSVPTPPSDGLTLLVTGGRTYGKASEHASLRDAMVAHSEAFRLYDVLDHIHATWRIKLLIEGAASGADELAHQWAKGRRVDNRRFPADWDRLGRSAGAHRNFEMLAAGRPDAAVACPGGRGTQHMITLLRQAHIPLWKVPPISADERFLTSALVGDKS